MKLQGSTDWWRDQIIISVSDFLKNPNEICDARLKSLLKAYKNYYADQSTSMVEDEHERAMDYR